ncbi:hypothetical protein ACU4GD_34980 [Cupriavidus basilensis]
MLATAPSAMIMRSWRQLLHQLIKTPFLLFAQQVIHRHADIVEEQLGGVLALLSDFFKDTSTPEAGQVPGLDHDERDATRAGFGTRPRPPRRSGRRGSRW